MSRPEPVQEINSHLVPVQMGEKECGEVLSVDRKAAEEYFALEDEAVTMAGYGMM